MSTESSSVILDPILLGDAGADVGDRQITVGHSLDVPIVPDDEARGADAFLCSTCRKPFPIAEITILPAFSDRWGRWVSAYRCREHVAGTIAAGHAKIARTRAPDEGAYVDFAGSFFELIKRYVRDQQPIKERVRGMDGMRALDAILELLEAGAVRFELGLEPDEFDDGTPEHVEGLLQQVTCDLFEKHGFASPLHVFFRSTRRPDEIAVRRYALEGDELVETKGRASKGPVPAPGEYEFLDDEGGFATLSVSPDGHAHVRFSK